MKSTTTDQAIHLNSDKLKSDSVVEVTYNGLLAQSGADTVYVHCGSSDSGEWEDVQDVKMTKKNSNTFSANVLIHQGKTFNVCFRDSAGNWDNNSGSNYSFEIGQ